MRITLVSLMTVTVLSACVQIDAPSSAMSNTSSQTYASGAEIAERAEQFTPGVTTKRDVRAEFGAPSQEMPSMNNFTTMMYDLQLASSDAEGAHESVVVVFLFDQEGKFVRSRFYAQNAE